MKLRGWISLDELTLYMTKGVLADMDHFVTTRTSKSNPWGTPVEIAELNSVDDEEQPTLSPNELLMWYGTGPVGQMPEYDIVSTVIQICDGDANRDGMVDPLDAGYVLARFACEPVDLTQNTSCFFADVNGDGDVDVLDSGYVLARLGTCDCPE